MLASAFYGARRRRRLLLAYGPPSALTSALVTAAFANAADGATVTTLTFTAKDASGNPMAGVPLTWSVERITLDAGESFILVNPSDIDSDGVDSSVITAQVTKLIDGEYVGMRGIPAANVVLAVSGTGNTVTQPSAATDRNGETDGSVVTTQAAATKTVSQTTLGLAMTRTATLTTDGTAPTTLYDWDFNDGTVDELLTYQIDPGVVVDATALAGYSCQFDWTSGAEYTQILAYAPAAQYAKLYIRMHHKQDATADNGGIKKTFRFRGNVGGSGGQAVGTFNIQSDGFLFFGDNYGNGLNEWQSGYGTSDAIYVDNKPDTLHSTWRYLEVMVDYTDTSRQKAKMWVDGVLIIDRDLALGTPVPDSLYFERLWMLSTFNNPADNRSEWIDEVVVATVPIGMPP